MDTIFALSTARGKAGLAVVRVSGPAAPAACAVVAGDVPAARRAALRRLRDGDRLIDEAIVLHFPAGASATGEATIEFHVHGSPAVVSALLACLGKVPGLRPAEPGEFTRRALEAGRLSLTEVEGLSDLLDAETESQRRQAMTVFGGALRDAAEGWRTALVRAAALVEATIDFVDEDVPLDVMPEVAALLRSVHEACAAELRRYPAAERIRAGFEVAIVGAPNVGKSTLLNRLAGREAAITSDVAGTTRDVIEVRMDIAGLAVTLIDTAGLREPVDPIEAIGIDRARQRAAAADLRVFLTEGGVAPPGVVMEPGDLVLRAKADDDAGRGDGVSGLTGAGVDWLLGRIAETLGDRVAGGALITRERHRRAIADATALLESVLVAVDRRDVGTEVLAEDIRSALRVLESLIGRVDVEAVLDEIFARFCIGK
ncbi:MAG: tRNA uridine-5-carboxymethylaminomethyl(34) synthesis GTPase MnmE [Gemmobacter sp.]